MDTSTAATQERPLPRRRPPARVRRNNRPPPTRGALPNLVVIGAQKCGTSGLHYHLGLHPEIQMSRPKELNYFVKEGTWRHGIDWYAQHFDPEVPVRGEASPNYTAYPYRRGVARRMHGSIPEAKLIYLVRDPLERIAAHWVHNYAKHREKGDLRTTVNNPRASYVARSRYAMQLRRYLRRYPLDQIMVIEQEELRSDRARTLRRVFEFAGVDADFEHPSFAREQHVTAAKSRASKFAVRLERMSDRHPVLAPAAKLYVGLDARLPPRRPIERPDVRMVIDDEILELLRDDAREFRELTGRPFEHWSI
jgi:Sulfotransferase domain